MRPLFWCFFCSLIGVIQSCAAPAAGDPRDISKLQGRWILESINGNPVESKTEIYFEIDGPTIRGFDGCNIFGGRLDAPARLRMTQRACESKGLRLPLELPNARPQLTSAEVIEGKLKLLLPDGKGEAGFRRQ